MQAYIKKKQMTQLVEHLQLKLKDERQWLYL